MSKYADSALLSKAREKRGNGPDYYGRLEFSEDTIRYLAQCLREGKEPILRIAVWRKENDRGVYLSSQVSIPREAEDGGSRRTQAARGQQRDAFDDRRPTTRRSDPVSNRPDDDFDDEIPF